jgi:site-specific DNA recombinase
MAHKEKHGAVIYCRVSTKEQASNLSLPVQEATCRAYCEKNGWDVVKIFQEAESAKTVNRTEFQQMLQFCALKHKEIVAVVVYDGTRFSRETMDALQVEAILNAKGIVVRSATQPFDESPVGTLMKTIVYGYATFDNKIRAVRTEEGMKAHIRDGLWVHRAPIGYVNVTPVSADAPNLIQDAERAPLLRQAFDEYASGSYSKSQLLDRMTALGLKDTSGKALSPQTFDKILRNPVYAGWIVSSWGIRARGRFEPIISEETYDRVQAVLAGKSANNTERTPNNPKFPLRVFMRCGICGTPLTASLSTGRHGGKYGYYRCREKTCGQVKFTVDDLHIRFTSFLESLRPTPGSWRLFERVLKDVWAGKRQHRAEAAKLVEKRIAELTTYKDKLVRTLVEGKLNQQLFDEQLARVEADLAEVHEQEVEILPEEEELSELLVFSRWVLENAGVVWLAADYEKKGSL